VVVKNRLPYLLALAFIALCVTQCAKKGNPTGGPKDTIPPVLVRTVPENFSTNFSANEIRIVFDEYIKLNELQKNLIISPPMEYPPVITPLNTSKTLKIKIQDTLLPNTTYSINFGNSIVDNNESVPFDNYKYVFSTGSYIDSLTLSGSIRDAERPLPENPTTVALYELDDQIYDSIVYFEKPRYVTFVKDSLDTFRFTNLKEGTYALVALKDQAGDYTFQPGSDKIGFAPTPITLPTDSTYTLTLFKETPEFMMGKPKLAGKQHITFGYSGSVDSLSLKLRTETPPNFEYSSYRDALKDSVHYWFKPNLEADSLVFLVSNRDYKDTLTVRLKELYRDSLEVSAVNAGVQVPRDTLALSANVPLVSIRDEYISVQTSDSVAVPFQTKLQGGVNRLQIAFPKETSKLYNVELLPGALVDFFENTNDTLRYRVQTKALSDYGTLALSFSNLEEFPVIVQLVDNKFKVVAEDYLTELRNVQFDFLNPGNYYVRLVFDENRNRRWDTGSYLEKRQPEEMIYYPGKIEIRANWDWNENFTLTGRSRDLPETEAVPEDR
jgi:uncharacterized protein (DUF2141 family)